MASVNANEWKPSKLLAGILALFLNAFAFLYVNKARWFWVYVIVTLIVAKASMGHYENPLLQSLIHDGYLSIALALICIGHSVYLAHYYDADEQRKWFARWYAVLLIVIGVFGLIGVVRLYVVAPFQIPSSAMLPTLTPGSHVLVSKSGFGNKTLFTSEIYQTESSVKLSRADIIVFRYPLDRDILYIKRVIGLPGETIRYENKQVFVKPRCLPETESCAEYKALELTALPEHTLSSPPLLIFQEDVGSQQHYIAINMQREIPAHFYFNQPGTPTTEWKVPANHYFVMGDSRDNSRDSRFWGFVPEHDIVGRVIYSW